MRDFATINSAAHRYPAIVSRAREEVPPDDVALFILDTRTGWSHARVRTYTPRQRARLIARIKELTNAEVPKTEAS